MINSEVMRFVNKGELILLKFKMLDEFDFINHAISTRYGGVSKDPSFASLNLGLSTSDDKNNIFENYKRFFDASGFDLSSGVVSSQTHSTNIKIVTSEDKGKGIVKPRDYTDIDALITNEKNIPLIIHSADCVPVTLIDVKNKVIACAHCGWRGTFSLLIEKTLHKMAEAFSTNPRDVYSTIGPCICKKCYNVSEDLYVEFLDKFSQSKALEKSDDKFYIDLGLLNKEILVSNGVKIENILVSDICTSCNNDLLFSHRAQNGKRGIFALGIELI